MLTCGIVFAVISLYSPTHTLRISYILCIIVCHFVPILYAKHGVRCSLSPLLLLLTVWLVHIIIIDSMAGAYYTYIYACIIH